MKKKLICITGADGSGKSTLIESLKQHYRDVYVATIWDLMGSKIKALPFKNKREVDEFLCTLTPGSRLLFLAHAMKYSIDLALASDAPVILIDSYYYKYFASELVLGADEKLVKALQQAFPVPDVTVELILTVEESARRKKYFSRYECGLAEKPDAESFIRFQKSVSENWKLFEKKDWHPVDAMVTPQEVLDETLKRLR
jgi:dTMP kinase